MKTSKKTTRKREVPTWNLMPTVSDFGRPARMMQKIEEDIRDSGFGITFGSNDYDEEDYF